MTTNLTTTRPDFDDKFDLIIRWYNSKDPAAKLPKPLEEQLDRWGKIYGVLCKPKNLYKSEAALLRAVSAILPDLSDRTLRQAIADARRFYGVLDAPNLAFEKVMLIASIKDAIRRAKAKNDLKSLAAAQKNLIAVLGADGPEEQAENRTIINVLNYNPAELGGEVMAEDKVQALIKRIMADDQKKKEQLFDDYQEVPTEP